MIRARHYLAAAAILICAEFYLLFPQQEAIRPAHAWVHGSIVPAPAQAVGFNTLTFGATFSSLSAIDTAKTNASGFNWYISNSWPNSTPTSSWISNTDTDPATLSVSNQTLTISTGINNTNQGVHSAVASGSNWKGTGFNGSTGGAYFEIEAAFNPAINPSNNAWPLAFLMDLRFLTGSVTRFGELDLFERNPPTFPLIMAIHDWNIASGSPVEVANNSGNWTVTPDLADGNFHKYGTLWQTTTKGGGTGSVQRYVDGVLHSFNTVTWTAGGNFSDIDAGTHVLILDAGGGVSTQFRVNVYQASMAGITVQ